MANIYYIHALFDNNETNEYLIQENVVYCIVEMLEIMSYVDIIQLSSIF